MDKAARGAAALAASNYGDAIKEYTAAISENPNAADYYIKRSTAYQRSSAYPEALADADVAVLLAHKRARRELIKEAQLRRAIALFFNEQYRNADFVLAIVKRLDDKEKTLAIWEAKVAAKLKALEHGDERGRLSVHEVPDVEVPSAAADSKAASKGEAAATPGAGAPAPTAPAPTPANRIKHDWYQNNDNVYFSLLARGVPKDKATVDIDNDSLSISFPIQDSASDYNYTLDPFYAPIDASKSSYRITPSKIEVTLSKSQPGVKWHTLEGDRSAASRDANAPSTSSIPSHILNPKSADAPPAYPTSSRKGAKDWDKVASDLSKKKTKDDDGAADDGLEDDYDGDETTRFFKHLYKGSTPEQQRAMMKSYSESGGTVLSTDWSNVGNRTVVPEPPDGMEAKKYGQ